MGMPLIQIGIQPLSLDCARVPDIPLHRPHSAAGTQDLSGGVRCGAPGAQPVPAVLLLEAA